MLITSVFSSSENGHKNAVASNPYWQVLPTADSGYKNNTPLKRAATESYSIHERLLKNGYSVLPLHYLAQNSHLIFLLSSICQNRFILTYHSRFTTTFQYVKEDIQGCFTKKHENEIDFCSKVSLEFVVIHLQKLAFFYQVEYTIFNG